jgi:4-amino-4-deoxy-L-arabinose transferase-like glycosyltransferase
MIREYAKAIPSPSSRPASQPTMPRAVRWLLLALILLAFGLYMWRLDAKSIWWDESLSLYRAQKSVAYILSNRIDFPGIYTTDQHPPLYFLVLHIVTRLCGESDLVLRFPSAVFASLMVPLLYAFGSRLRGYRAGMYAACLGAFSPFYLWYAQEARGYAMATMLGLASVYALWRALTERNWSWGLGGIVLAGATAATQYLGVLVLAFEILLALYLWPRTEGKQASKRGTDAPRRHSTLLLIGSITLFLCIIVLGYPILFLIPSFIGRGHYFVHFFDLFRYVLHGSSLGESVSPEQGWVWDTIFAIIYLLGVISIWQQPPNIAHRGAPKPSLLARSAGLVLILGYIFVPLAILWFASWFFPIFTGNRYIIVFTPAFYLGLGMGLDSVACWRPSRWGPRLATGLLAILLTGMGLSSYHYFFDASLRTKEDYRSLAQRIMADERVGDAVLVVGPESLPAFQHYYRGQSPVIGVPLQGPLSQNIADELSTLIKPYDRVWLALARMPFSDPQGQVQGWLNGHTLLLSQETFPSYGSTVSLHSYLAHPPEQSSTQNVAQPLGVFDERLNLLGYTIRYLDAEAQTHEITAGEARQGLLSPGTIPSGRLVSVVFVWQPQSTLEVYKISLRLLDASGTVWAQRDREPFMYLPTDKWNPGTPMRHEADLPIPFGTPPGVYNLQLWVYKTANEQPLSFRDWASNQEQPFVDLGCIAVGTPQGYAPEESIPASAQRPWQPTVWDGKLELLAYQILPETLQPSGVLELQFYWRARQVMTQDYDLVVNVQDGAGRVWFTTSCPLTSVDYPTSHWHKGELVRGLLSLSLPSDAPPGKSQVHILIHARDQQSFPWLRQGFIPWAGHDLMIGQITLE